MSDYFWELKKNCQRLAEVERIFFRGPMGSWVLKGEDDDDVTSFVTSVEKKQIFRGTNYKLKLYCLKDRYYMVITCNCYYSCGN